MAPEQARGEAVDERADVYAAALLAWRLATGRIPFGRQRKDEWEILRAMRNPRIPPLATLRPDLPESVLDAVGRALEPERAKRTISAAELADQVRAHFDVGAGWIQLAGMLERWKGTLERSVKRTTLQQPAEVTADTDSSGGRAALTLRYEEVALAFDDDPPEDGPTVEAHALPSDLAILAAMPLVPDDQADSEPAKAVEPAPQSPPGAALEPSPAPSPPPSLRSRISTVRPARPPAAHPPARRSSLRVSAFVALVAFVAMGLVAGWLATMAR
jgi:hypothetical protein